jgi:hypothetical protein
MDFFQKLIDSLKQAFSGLSQGFSNFSFAALFGIGSAQAAPPPAMPNRPAVVVQQPQAQPGRAPVVAPTAQPSAQPAGTAFKTSAEMRTEFAGKLTPEQRALYADHNAKKNPFPTHDADGQRIAYGIDPNVVRQANLSAAEARQKFESTLTPAQLREHRAVERTERAEEKARIAPGQDLPGRSAPVAPGDDPSKVRVTGRINPQTGLMETVTPADPALGDRGVATVTLTSVEPPAAPPPAAAAPADEPIPQRAMRAERPRVYTEQGPNGMPVQVRPSQYENRPYMGESGPDRSGFNVPRMQPFRQETPERAAFNPHNVNSVQNQVSNAINGQIMARVGNSVFAPLVGGVLAASRPTSVPDMRGQFGQAAGYGSPYGDPAMDRQAIRAQERSQALINDGIQGTVGAIAERIIPQHPHQGGAFGALLGKLGR